MHGELLEPKVQAIRKYIYNETGVDIIDINLQTHEDILKLNWAYEFLININKNCWR